MPVEWQQLMPGFGMAVLPSVLALLVRCRQQGRVCASWASTGWATGVIFATSAASSLLGEFVPVAVPVTKPIEVAIVLPFVLCTPTLLRGQREQAREPHTMLVVVSAGISVLLDRLDTRMSLDKDAWVTTVPYRTWSLEELRHETLTLSGKLQRLKHGNKACKSEIDEYQKIVVQNAHRAQTVRTVLAEEKARHAAEQAFLRLRTKQYEWGYHEDSTASRARTGLARRRWPWRRGRELAGS